MKKVLVVYGSLTNEDKYGVVSGKRVAEALIEQGIKVKSVHAGSGKEISSILLNENFDAIVPVGFGPPCEDGQVYALARFHGVPCAGPTPATGSITLDKHALSLIVSALFSSEKKIRSPIGVCLQKGMSNSEKATAIKKVSGPYVVKANYGGSSEGMAVVNSLDEVMAQVNLSMDAEGKVLVQKLELEIAHEISCTVLDVEDGPIFFPIVELRRGDVDVMGPEEKFGEEGLDRHILPATLTPEMAAQVQDAVLKLHQEIGLIGLTRTDLLILKSGEIVILEQNGIPGLLESSIACDAALAAGINFNQLSMHYARSAFLDRPEPRVWGDVH